MTAPAGGLRPRWRAAIVLVGIAAALVIGSPVAVADPQQCDTAVGQSIDAYLQRHPDVKQELTDKGRAESPGDPDPVLGYLNRHPHVRQALITLSQQCA
ncbi:heme-binding protein [Mycobacterium sp. 1274756.6]|uniref:heme-binding protein n=1 Tax=Mycobacterium sp. 1274756.6 TaxID=1834076 RepID=UPI0007FBFD6D|nr:heme-binding protein [Mycobacterium sp. 1274756.6]OBJ68761.1 hypothetical protein A5643_13730 [Mycobacterium sp. 1274756.6]